MLGWIFGGLVKNFERVANSASSNLVKSAGKEVNRLFDEQIFPLALKFDYIAEQRISQAKVEMEELETKTKTDIEYLLNNADGRARNLLEEVDKLRQATIKDIAQTDAYIENRINQISLVVMQALSNTESLAQTTLTQINALESKLFQDANYVIEHLEVVIDKTLQQIRNELKRYIAHFLPNPFDKCKQKLKLVKPGFMLSDWELYELSECYEVSKLTEKTDINEVLKIYGQLQYNAAMTTALVKNAPDLKRRAVLDWIKYGVLCDFWRDTIRIYDYNNPILLTSQEQPEILTGNQDI